jgi:hypothetical protein
MIDPSRGGVAKVVKIGSGVISELLNDPKPAFAAPMEITP